MLQKLNTSQKKYRSYQLQTKLDSQHLEEQWVAKQKQTLYRLVSIPLACDEQLPWQTIIRLGNQLEKYKNITHRSIIKVKEVVFETRQPQSITIVNQIDDQSDLLTFINQRRHNDLANLKNVLISLAQALTYLHSKQVIHDSINLHAFRLKKDKYRLCFNVFREVKKYLDPEQREAFQNIQYSSPEKNSKKCWGKGADVWSLGIVFLELITGDRITNMMSQFPFESVDFPNRSIAGRLANQSIRELIYDMVHPEERYRLPIGQVATRLTDIDFFKVEEYKERIYHISSNLITFQVNLFQVETIAQVQQKESLSLFPSLNSFKCYTEINSVLKKSQDFQLKITFEAKSKESRLRIKVKSKNNKNPFKIVSFISYSQLNSEAKAYFETLYDFYFELQDSLSTFSVQNNGFLLVIFDRQRCSALREMNEEKTKTIWELKNEQISKQNGAPVQKSQTQDQGFFLNIFSKFIKQSTPHYPAIQGPTALGSKKEDKVFNIEITQDKGQQSEEQEEVCFHDAPYFMFDSTYRENDLQTIAILEIDSATYRKSKQYQMSLQVQHSIKDLQQKYYPKNHFQLLYRNFRIAELYIFLYNFQQALKHFKLVYRMKSSHPSIKIYKKSSLMHILICCGMTMNEQLMQRWVSQLQKDYPLTWKEIRLASFGDIFSMTRRKEVLQFIFFKIYAVIELEKIIDNYDDARSYFIIFRTIMEKSLLEYYEYGFQILARAVTYFKSDFYPESKQYIEDLIKNFSYRLKHPTMYAQSLPLIKTFIKEHLKQYEAEILKGAKPKGQEQRLKELFMREMMNYM